jgi:hypothetical protein
MSLLGFLVWWLVVGLMILWPLWLWLTGEHE